MAKSARLRDKVVKSARAQDDIVGDIVAVLNAGTRGDQNDDEKIGSYLYVRSAISYLSTLYPSPAAIPLWGHRSENHKQTKALRLQIQKLQVAIRAMPDRALFLLFAPDVDGTVNYLPEPLSQEKAIKRGRAILATLAYMRNRCERMIAAPPGQHKSADALQQEVVKQAADLLVRHKKRATNSSSSTSPLRRISSFLYEAVTGEQGKDLESACRDFFKGCEGNREK